MRKTVVIIDADKASARVVKAVLKGEGEFNVIIFDKIPPSLPEADLYIVDGSITLRLVMKLLAGNKRVLLYTTTPYKELPYPRPPFANYFEKGADVKEIREVARYLLDSE